MELTHFNDQGRARMVDVTEKPPTVRTAQAEGRVRMSAETAGRIRSGGIAKGDVLAVAQVAGIMAAKRASEIIPLCHRLNLTGTEVAFRLLPEDCAVEAVCTAKCGGRTGVEMEALTGVSAALLTVYDMCKAVDRGMVISGIHLLEKHGGKSGDFYFKEDTP